MDYAMGGTILSKTVKEKDLGVTTNANMKVSEQCRMAASKGNQVLGMIRHNFFCLSIFSAVREISRTFEMLTPNPPPENLDPPGWGG